MNKQSTRPPTRQERRRDRREELRRREEERRHAAARNRIIIIASIVAAVVIIAGASVLFIINQQRSSAQTQTPTTANPAYPVVDNIIGCDQQEQTAFHIHVHVSIYINGKISPVPQNVGIASDNSCLYWLHTHDSSGVIHIESPAGRSYTLGNFLDEWSNQFPQLGYPNQLDDSNGWTVYINGKPFNGDFHKIPFQAHALITLAYNSPGVKPDTTYSWGNL